MSYGLGAQWKLDVFGQERNRRAAAAALAYAAEDELEASRLATTTERIQAFYMAGQCPLTDVLQAQASQLELRDSLLQAQLQLFRASLALYDALGGLKPADPSPDLPS